MKGGGAWHTSKMLTARKATTPIRIICVTENIRDLDNETVKVVQKHCQDLNIEYGTRQFNSRKYSDDRDNITRLPAFHLYSRRCLKSTFYTTDDVIDIIDGHFNKARKEEEELRQVSKSWFELPRKMFKLASSSPASAVAHVVAVEKNPMHK